MRFVIIGNPENRRVEMFQQALASRSLAPAIVFPYVELLQDSRRLSDLAATCEDPRVVVRVESPGEDFAVQRLLLIAGEAESAEEGSPTMSSDEVRRLQFDRGLILHPRQAFLGFRALLRKLEKAAARFMNRPTDIAVMFDKREVSRRLTRGGVSMPRSLNPIQGYDDLISKMERENLRRVFVKLAHGSSASGVIAFHRGAGSERALTTIEMVREGGGIKMYNSLKLRTYNARPDVADLIDAICREGAHVERWIQKAKVGDANFDLRVMVINGVAGHAVVRKSKSPITNLHLGNQRGELNEVVARMGPVWPELLASCQDVMREEFPNSLYAGVDVAVENGFRRPLVLEVNAFGDLLPGVMHEGLGTHAAELRACLEREGSATQ